MQNKYNLIFFLSLLLLSCSDKESAIPNKVYALEARSLEKIYNCPDTRYSLNISLKESFIVIKDQSTFDNLVSGPCKPNIDFSSYNLLIGKKGLTSGNTAILYDIQELKNSQKLNIIVTFYQNSAAIAPNITYHTLFPKEYTVDKLIIEIKDNK